jgi:hypothetical protein
MDNSLDLILTAGRTLALVPRKKIIFVYNNHKKLDSRKMLVSVKTPDLFVFVKLNLSENMIFMNPIRK